ncbi:hypothetical protein SAMN04487969_101439 [Paenibacillus algorifonticola]|uniref:Uncharacterized protein n=1 Tax=Paenibacillus algorifonticola TaxID=684063 RepID=A0A1I1YBK6_9BACL|nr:hypothetical protein [Paenibacillus algorifonticola]SFE16964.1 hypothetical protein SAMN04487969_101439 [Paenibacillus algorifonticola]
MAFKPIDLQISVPRTPESSGLQGQMNHKPMSDQTKLAEQQAAQTELVRHKNTEVEHSAGLNVRQDQETSKQSDERKGKRKKQDEQDKHEENHPPVHPYKGHHVDISL